MRSAATDAPPTHAYGGQPEQECSGDVAMSNRDGAKPDQHQGGGGLHMADKNSLGVLGFLFGGITFAVTIIAFLVVRDHVEGRLHLDGPAMGPQLVSMTSTGGTTALP